MKRQDIHVGSYYLAKVSNKLCSVKITEELTNFKIPKQGMYGVGFKHRHGGWNAINEQTGRKIHIRSAARLKLLLPLKLPI